MCIMQAEREDDGHAMISLGLLIVSQSVDAFSQDEQRRVDVSRLFQTLAFILCLGATL